MTAIVAWNSYTYIMDDPDPEIKASRVSRRQDVIVTGAVTRIGDTYVPLHGG